MFGIICTEHRCPYITGCPEAGNNSGGTYTPAQQRGGVTEEKYMVLYDFKAQVNKYSVNSFIFSLQSYKPVNVFVVTSTTCAPLRIELRMLFKFPV